MKTVAEVTGVTPLTEADEIAIGWAVGRLNVGNIAAAMRAVLWTWRIGDEERVPNADEIREEARKLAREALAKGTSVECGGFRVTGRDAGTDDPYILIEFVFEASDSGEGDGQPPVCSR